MSYNTPNNRRSNLGSVGMSSIFTAKYNNKLDIHYVRDGARFPSHTSHTEPDVLSQNNSKSMYYPKGIDAALSRSYRNDNFH
jgi:hypothetical protein